MHIDLFVKYKITDHNGATVAEDRLPWASVAVELMPDKLQALATAGCTIELSVDYEHTAQLYLADLAVLDLVEESRPLNFRDTMYELLSDPTFKSPYARTLDELLGESDGTLGDTQENCPICSPDNDELIRARCPIHA